MVAIEKMDWVANLVHIVGTGVLSLFVRLRWVEHKGAKGKLMWDG